MHPEMSWATAQLYMSDLRREAELARTGCTSDAPRPRPDGEVVRWSVATRLRWARA